ncbi:MAG: transcription elongation factor GreB [Myxococcaceae bacterium]
MADTDPEPPDDDEEEPAVARKSYITRAGAERLHQELLGLLNVERPRVTAEVSAAAAQGDRSENAEYIYGKKRLREIDRRLRFLKKRLDSAVVVTPSEQKDTQTIYFGATVTLEDEEGAKTSYQLVGPDETDTKGGKISVDSPIGRALLGRRKGDQVTVMRPRGEICLTVLSIRYV